MLTLRIDKSPPAELNVPNLRMLSIDRSLSLDLLLYGTLLCVLSIVAHRLSSYGGGMALWIGIAGGAPSVLVGGLGLLGYPTRAWAAGVTATLSFVLIIEAVFSWLAVQEGVDAAKDVALFQTLLSAFAVVQFMNIVRSRSGRP